MPQFPAPESPIPEAAPLAMPTESPVRPGRTASSPGVTEYLRRWNAGESDALNQIIPLVYGELRKIARRYMGGERKGHLLQTTALINEAFLRLIHSSRVQWQDRKHFFAISAQLMRRVLVDFARSRDVPKRSGKLLRVNFEEAEALPVKRDHDLVALDDALNTLGRFDPRKARVVELRYFGGLSVRETAEVMGVSEDTVLRDWTMAKAWLRGEMENRPGNS